MIGGSISGGFAASTGCRGRPLDEPNDRVNPLLNDRRAPQPLHMPSLSGPSWTPISQ
jgi:hypothetical protein